MKRKVLSGLFILASYFSYSQNSTCSFDESSKKIKNLYPALWQIWNNSDEQSVKNVHPARGIQSLVTIPVVVHVIYHDPSENISDQQIISQIDVLNEDFRKLNADTGIVRPIFQPFAGDAQVEFCLAKRDPNGDSTTGITRTYSTRPDWGCDDSMKFSAYGGSDGWPGADYLNIWVCKLNCANGYAYYPGTPDPYDGVVVHYYVFGRIGNVAPGHIGRTGSHEAGHYLGLYHTFDYLNCNGTDTSNCLTGGDKVCDTPADNNPDYGCPTFVNDCADSPIDNPDQTENYMDYGDDGCRVMFSLGQIDRMRGFLFGARSSLITSLGCVPPGTNYYDVSVLSMEEPPEEICESQVAPVIRVANSSSVDLISLDVHYSLDSGPILMFTWTDTIASGTIGFITIPSITFTAGSHLLHVAISNPNGNMDQNATNNNGDFTVDVITTGLAVPYAEGFETSGFPYSHWSISNPDNGYGWEHTNLAGAQGSVSSLRSRNFYNSNRGTMDDVLTPKYDLIGQTGTAVSFDVAYSDPGSNYYSDTLRLYYSIDCGITWTLVWEDGGATLATCPAPITFQEFVPDSTEWQNILVDLTPYGSHPLFSLKFENKNGWGNDLYVDNINLSVSLNNQDLNTKGISVYPNPASDRILVSGIDVPGTLKVEIFNSVGKEVLSVEKVNLKRMRFKEVSASSLESGIYFLKISSAGYQPLTFKVFVIH